MLRRSRTRHTKTWAPIFVLLVLAGCASTRPDGVQRSAPKAWNSAADAINSELDDAKYERTNWAVTVVDLSTDEIVYRRNAATNMTPASNTKLYTTAAALDLLGPDYTYTTTVVTDGLIDNGVLFGNVYVIGSGDPVIGGQFEDDDELAIFRSWADSLKAMGIKTIRGDIVGDDDIFDDTVLGPGWMWDDEIYCGAGGSAEIGGLSFNDNCVNITVSGTREGEPADVAWGPGQSAYATIVNETMTIVVDSLSRNIFERERAQNTIRVGSLILPGRSITRAVSVSNPTRFFVTVLRETLEREGIQVIGYPVDVDDLEMKPNYDESAFSRVASHTSVPMREIVDAINKPSHNLYAEMVLKTVGMERAKRNDFDEVEGSWPSGIRGVMDFLAKANADTSSTRLLDGSGLSRYNRVTTETTIALLTYMWNHPDRDVFEAFYASLPVGGVDGSLDGRYPSGRARNNVHAKTGTVRYVSTLSGYVHSANGTPLAFSIMANDFAMPTSQIRLSQDVVVEQLAKLQL